MNPLEIHLSQKINAQKQAHLYRKRTSVDTIKNISFCSNDYLGLCKHPEVIQAFKTAADRYGVGSGSAYLVSGYASPHQELEESFAEFLGRERALLFSNGYTANLGVFQALVQNGDAIFADKQNHASLIDGALLSQAHVKRYRSGDLSHLDSLLQKSAQQLKLIVTDSVFSMTGNLANLVELSVLSKKYGSCLLVDDAHGIGIFGKEGRGSIDHFQLSQNEVPVLISPLGKALGGFGAIVSGSETIIEGLIQFARTYKYTTAIPPAIAAAAKESLRIMRSGNHLREKLKLLVHYFKQGAAQRNLNLMPSVSPIQFLVIGDALKTLIIQQELARKNLLVAAIRSPTVTKNNQGLRITLNCQLNKTHIDFLLDHLKELYENTY